MTKRETEILTLLKQGQSPKEIAFALGLSLLTVYNYLAALRRLYHVRTTVQLRSVHVLS